MCRQKTMPAFRLGERNWSRVNRYDTPSLVDQSHSFCCIAVMRIAGVFHEFSGSGVPGLILIT